MLQKIEGTDKFPKLDEMLRLLRKVTQSHSRNHHAIDASEKHDNSSGLNFLAMISHVTRGSIVGFALSEVAIA